MPRKNEAKVTGVWEKVTGSGVWWIRYRVEGKLKREKVGRKGDAVALYQQRKSEIRAGAKLPKNLRNAGVKFKELSDAILTCSASHHRDTKNIRIRLAKISAEFAERLAETVKPEEIDAWLTERCKTPATANRYRALFSLVYREALRNGKVSSNPARLVRQRHEDNVNIRWLEADEEARLRAVMAERYPHHIPELEIALGTGMRLSEQYGLTWSCVDLKRREIRLRMTKNYSGRSIPMNSDVFMAFTQLKKMADKGAVRVFPIKNPRKWFGRAQKLAEVTKRFRWHDFRHTFCSRLAMNGKNVTTIQALAGHKTITIAGRYSHLDDATSRAAVDELVKH